MGLDKGMTYVSARVRVRVVRAITFVSVLIYIR